MPDRKSISNAILTGIQTANVEYEKWSNGWWITDSGVEGLLVAAIAKKLHAELLRGESLVMELPFSDIQEWSEAQRPRGRPREMLRGANRADIVLLDERGRPTCMVEVKRLWERNGCFHDLTRIRDLLLLSENQQAGSLERGFLAVMLAKREFVSRSAGDRTRNQARQIKTVIREKFPREGLTLRCHLGEVRDYPPRFQRRWNQPNWAHAGLCIELARP